MIAFPLWDRVAAYGAGLGDAPVAAIFPADDAVASSALRRAVAECLRALARQIQDAVPQALASASRAWDRVDNLTLLDAPLAAHVSRVWRQLDAAATAADAVPAARAVALEGLLAIHTAYELTRLHERKLSSLIRLRMRSGTDDLLPGGRPFLDLAAALEETASAWA